MQSEKKYTATTYPIAVTVASLMLCLLFFPILG